MKKHSLILPVIVFSQFCCTSLWFAGNGVMDDLVITFGLEPSSVSLLTSAVQLGFIAGTLAFAILTIADRYSPSKVFMISAFLGSAFNAAIIWEGHHLDSILICRFFTGFFLAGIYPVGMKIAADYYEKGLGKSLGFLVGALVLGTAFPHLLKDLSNELPWKSVIHSTSALGILGGLLMRIMVPNGPFRAPGQRPDLSACVKVFRQRDFRNAAIGYFGHMWELYAFWAFVPVILAGYSVSHPEFRMNISLLSFVIIAVGGPACIVAGYLSQRLGTQRVAVTALTISGLCCLISPFLFTVENHWIFVAFLIFWGMMVVADSPLFSTLVASNTAPEIKGTALTIVNSIGFAITIVSIQLVAELHPLMPFNSVFLLLALGPLLGVIVLGRNQKGSLS